MASKLTAGRLFSLLKVAGNEWIEDKAMKMSAALAYYTTVSIAPLIIITIKIISIFYRKHASDLLQAQLGQLTDPKIAEALGDAILKAGNSGAGTFATLISILIALMGASGVFGELQDSLNTIWEVRPKPNRGITGVIQDRFLSMTMVLAIAFLLLVTMFVSTLVTGVSTATVHTIVGGNGHTAQGILYVVNLLLSLVVVTVLFAAIFRFLPDVSISWRDVGLGAFVTAILFEIGKTSLSLYFKYGSPTSAYGAAGSMVAVLLWVCYSAYILFFGAEFTQVYANEFGSRIVPAPNAEPLTEAMRARAGIPHDAGSTNPGAPAGAHPGVPAGVPAAGAQLQPRTSGGYPPATPWRPVTRPHRRLPRRPRPSLAAPPEPRPSYVVRYLPLVAAVVLARFAWRRYRADHVDQPVVVRPWWRSAGQRWMTGWKAARPALAPPLLSWGPAAAKLWRSFRGRSSKAVRWTT
jgi:membrane protein